MTFLLDDELNLRLLSLLCAGKGLEINLLKLSKVLDRHRETIRKRVKELLRQKIIDRPIYPYIELFKEYPLLVIAYADLPNDGRTENWLSLDKNIFSAFKVREGDYNMMLFEFHRGLEEYLMWRDRLTVEGKIPERRVRIPSSVIYVSNRSILKYEPNVSLKLIEIEMSNRGKTKIGNVTLDPLTLQIMKSLLSGVGIKTNENLIGRDLQIHRATVKNRIQKLLRARIILPPLCRFPNFFVPPDFLLVFSMLELKHRSSDFEKDILHDPHISVAYHISQGRYNLLLFEVHRTIEDYLIWEAEYSKKYPLLFGSIKNNYLSPQMTIDIDQQKVSLAAIEDRLLDLTQNS